MESIKRLRELAEDINCYEIIDHIHTRPRFMVDGEWLDSWHKEFDAVCDAIEAEIAEKYMELPLDADGIPIRVGDEVTWLNGTPSSKFTIDTFVFDMEHGEWDVEDSNFLNIFSAHRCRHIKPRTLEDVLQSAGVSVAAIEDVAAEIRELLGVEQ